MRIAVAVLTAACLLTACSSGPKIFVNENPAASFDNYATYNFEPQLGTDDRKGYRSILSNQFISAINREMQARGYKRSDNPDLRVNVYVHTKEKIRTTSTPTAGGYYGYRGYGYGMYGGYETTTTQYTEGTVNIDLIDNANNELAWEGVAVGRINDEVRQNLEASVSAVVGEVFTRYKYTAPGFVPPVAEGTG